MVAVGSALKVFSEASEQAARQMDRETRQSERIATSKGAERGASLAGLLGQKAEGRAVFFCRLSAAQGSVSAVDDT